MSVAMVCGKPNVLRQFGPFGKSFLVDDSQSIRRHVACPCKTAARGPADLCPRSLSGLSGGDALPDASATAFIPGTDLDILLEHAVKVFLPGGAHSCHYPDRARSMIRIIAQRRPLTPEAKQHRPHHGAIRATESRIGLLGEDLEQRLWGASVRSSWHWPLDVTAGGWNDYVHRLAELYR